MLVNSFFIASLYFVPEFGLGWFQVMVKVLGPSGMGLVLVVIIDKLIRILKFFMVFFSFIACLIILCESSLYKAWSFFKVQTTFGLTVMWE